jgi:hypothetical protein
LIVLISRKLGLVVGSFGEVLEDPLPDVGSGPAGKAAMDIRPVAKALRPVAPKDPGAITVKDSVDE